MALTQEKYEKKIFGAGPSWAPGLSFKGARITCVVQCCGVLSDADAQRYGAPLISAQTAKERHGIEVLLFAVLVLRRGRVCGSRSYRRTSVQSNESPEYC